MIRTATRLGILAALLIALSGGAHDAAAQHAAAVGPHGDFGTDAGIGDVPSGPAMIRGRVVHRTRPEAAGDLPVALFALSTNGRPGTRTTLTELGGEFEFPRVSNDPGTVYLLAVHYQEIPFGARIVFGTGDLESTSVIEISDTSADASDLGIGAARLRVDRGCNGIRISEAHTLRNPSEFVLQVPPEQRGMRPPIFRVELPPAAAAFAPGRGSTSEALELQGNVAVFWGPLYPGDHEVEFTYSIAGGDETLAIERRFPRGVENAMVLTWVNEPLARGEGLRPAGEVTVDGVTYGAVESGALARGESVAFSLDLGTVEPSGERLSLPEIQVWLELDDAALDVREQFEFAVSGHEALRSDSDAPLLCLDLPPGAEDLRFSAEAFGMGIQPDATGGLALLGPIPPGKSGFAVSYLLASGSDGIDFARSYPIRLSRLALQIADTGLRTETDRLHRLRPVRSGSRSYIRLEGFEIEPNETIALKLTNVRPQQPLPRMAAVGFVAAAAILSVAFLAAPWQTQHAAMAAADDGDETSGERESVYAAIRDLEDDFDTGKISPEDRDVMLRELRARAGALVRQERVAATAAAAEQPAAVAAPPEPAPAPACLGCGAALAEEARFCSRCGRSRAGASPSGGPRE